MRPTRPAPAPAWPSATPSARSRWRWATARRCAPGRRGWPAGRCAASSPSARGCRSWRRPRSTATRRSRSVEERVAAELEFLPKRDRRRAEREGLEAGRRSQRRARTRALDSALALCGLWLRDVACIVDGAEELVHATDRAEALREDAAGRETAHRLHDAVGLVDETRAALILNPTEELALEALASRLARLLG